MYTNYGLVFPVLPILTGLLSSLNPFSSGPDKTKWEARAKRVAANIRKAQAGDILAWYALGAFGRPSVPLPVPLNPPYVGAPRAAGFTVEQMGKDYNPIRDQARQAYDALTSQFIKLPGMPAGPVPTMPAPGPSVPPPVVGTGPLPFPTQPFPGEGNNLPVYTPDPTQGQVPAPMQPVQQSTVMGIPSALAWPLLGVGLLALVLNQPRRNPPRRRASTRRRR